MTQLVADIIGSLKVTSPDEAVKLQLSTGLDIISDGQVYTHQRIRDANLPFLLDRDGIPLLPEILIEEESLHRIVRLQAKLKEPVEPTKSMIVASYEAAIKAASSKKNREKVKFIHPMPLTLMNVFSFQSINAIYGKRSRHQLLRDIYNFILIPIAEYIIEKHDCKYIQGDDPAIFDEDIFGTLIDEEFKINEEFIRFCMASNVKFMFYVPDVPLPDNLKPKIIRQRIFQLPNVIVWMFIDEYEKEEKFLQKIRFIKRYYNKNEPLALGILESNKDHMDNIRILEAKLYQIISELDPSILHITPRGGFKGVDKVVAERKMRNLVELRDRID